jgi:hypothetical protein
MAAPSLDSSRHSRIITLLSLKRLPSLTDAARCHLTPLEMAGILETELIPGSGMPLAKVDPVPGVTNPRGDIDSEFDSAHFSSGARSRQSTLGFSGWTLPKSRAIPAGMSGDFSKMKIWSFPN